MGIPGMGGKKRYATSAFSLTIRWFIAATKLTFLKVFAFEWPATYSMNCANALLPKLLSGMARTTPFCSSARLIAVLALLGAPKSSSKASDGLPRPRAGRASSSKMKFSR